MANLRQNIKLNLPQIVRPGLSGFDFIFLEEALKLALDGFLFCSKFDYISSNLK